MSLGNAAADTAVSLNNVRFIWPGRHAFGLSVDDLTIRKGEKLFLLGDSGSGKSTLLSLICGVNLPQAGSVTVNGTELTRLRSGARDRFRAEQIGIIFQMFNLLAYATPLDNILLPLSFAPERRMQAGSDAAGEALRLTRLLGLPDTLISNSPAARLSVGQQQRVAVARALIGRPPLIVADEPTSSLDASAQTAFLDMLFDQVSAEGITLIMVSHDLRLAERFDRQVDLKTIATTERSAA